jgi:3-deoxy-manno-octulosonate cytidylyltransferase (CMP-KDO synthetase)
MSRQAIPTGTKIYKRQVGIYAFWMYQLIEYYGAGHTKGFLEAHENIEILRLLELGVKVKMVQLKHAYQSVDVPGDIKKVEEIINKESK